MSDSELVSATLLDTDKYAVLVERYEHKIKKYVRNFLYVTNEDAEDIVQETFINAFRFLRSFNLELSFSSWLYRIAHNQCVSFLRKHSNRMAVEYIPKDVEDDFLESISSDIDTEEEALKEMNYERLEKGLAQLSLQYREVLVLRYKHEKEYSEISSILKVPEGTVASLIHRAKVKLIEILNHE